MNNLIAYKHSIVAFVLFAVTISLQAQSTYKESFDVTGEVLVSVNTSYTNVTFETWNKDKVEVEAYIESDDLTEKEKEEIFENWKFNVLGNSSQVIVSSFPEVAWGGMESISGLDALKELEFLGPMMQDMPMLTTLKVPAFPEDLMKNMQGMKFDYEAFNENEEEYMKKWEADVKEKFGKDFGEKMEKWGEEFANQWNENNGDKLNKEWAKRMEAWQQKFGKEMEAWGENFGKDMEKWAEQFENENGKNGSFSKKVITDPKGNKTIIFKSNTTGKLKDAKATKNIIIRMPKNTRTEIDVRHGEIKMADVKNVRATLNYSPLTANSIDGDETLINAAYAPVIVDDWKYGTLYVKFVEDCIISNIESINLRSNSSNIFIGMIAKNADLTGSLGTFRIDEVDKDFKKINITLKNNDAILMTPDTAFTFYFTGKKSTLKYPRSLELTNTKKDGEVLVQGFKTERNPNKTFTINALYSNLQVQ